MTAAPTVAAFSVSAEQRQLRDALRSVLSSRSPSTRVRALMATDNPFDMPLWEVLTTQMGLAGLMIPEEYGGVGASFAEAAIVCEELGRSLACVPYLSSAVLSAALVLECGTDSARRTWLPRIAAGDRRLTVALIDAGSSSWDPDQVTLAVEDGTDGPEVTGTKRFVIDGMACDDVLVVARHNGGLSLVHVAASERGTERAPLTVLDQTRGLAELEFRAAPAQLISAPGEASAGIARARLFAAAAVVAESVGGAERCLEMAVAYAKTRYQFGRLIGSYQAISHRCADMLASLELARSASQYAAHVLSTEASDHERVVAVSTAKAFTSEAYLEIAGDNIQIHGGIGFTWEHDAHLYFKRAKSNHQLFGDPVEHRQVLARELKI